MSKTLIGSALAAALAIGGAWHLLGNKPVIKAAEAATEKPVAAVPTRTLRVALEGKYPPFEFINAQKQLVGFNIDVANALCAEIKARCEFKRYGWDELIPALQKGEADAIIASMSITPERQQKVLFTYIYTRVPGAYIAPKTERIIWPVITAERIRDKTIGVPSDTTFDDYVKHELEPAGVKVKRYPSAEDVFAALKLGEVQLVFGDSAVLTDFIRVPGNAEQFEVVGNKVQGSEWLGQGEAIAIAQNQPALRDELNGALQKLITSTTYDELQNRYFLFRVL
ncbi:transporter substrate-binding domain-containing protein [Chitinolyticbacter meiyuanensis]|uniref:transporter substrate-binding domain-containing protein n=1 Tax=Chitinolyticbacter meiyuanensis TaxID=682798 RepID=UPI0011E5E88C|nr:transporter substrate-binding domain-containing protein [Chitinolyticbacter meiyuanensis]